MKRILYMISLLCLGLLSTGCDSEEQPGEEEKRTVEVPVEFNFTSSGNELTTRTNPVGPHGHLHPEPRAAQAVQGQARVHHELYALHGRGPARVHGKARRAHRR